jgi:hypothetical protein
MRRLKFPVCSVSGSSIGHPLGYQLASAFDPKHAAMLHEHSRHEGNGAVGHSLSGERAFEKQVADAVAAGKKPLERAGKIYGAPCEDAEVFNINAGE